MVARRQLIALGLTSHAIQRGLDTGRLHAVHRGVYAVGHTSVSGRGVYMAAVLACGPGALLSHVAAADHLGLRQSAARLVDVTAPGRNRRGRPGLRLHHPRGLGSRDRRLEDGIPVTSVARTLLDLADVLRPRQLERAFEAAERLRLLDLRAVEELLDRSRRRAGVDALRAVIAAQSGPVPETRSELERRFLDICSDAGIPRPEVNVLVEGLEVDALWRRERVVVELDGRRYHGTGAAFERDRRRDERLQLADHVVLRFTALRLGTEPASAADAVLQALAARASSGSATSSSSDSSRGSPLSSTITTVPGQWPLVRPAVPINAGS